MRHCAINWMKNTRGSLMPIFALSLTAIIALVAATIALGMDSRAANNLQSTADSAALSGATAFINAASARASDRLGEAYQSAKSVAASNSEYAIRSLDVSAVTEDPYGQKTSIQVDVSFEPANAMARIAGRNGTVAITRSATAEATWGFPLCILALEENQSGITTQDKISLTADNCLIWSNSKSQHSMEFAGGDIRAKYLCAASKVSRTNGAQIIPLPTENCNTIPDPLHDWKPPAAAAPQSTPAENVMPVPGELRDWLEIAITIGNNFLAEPVDLNRNSPNYQANLLSAAKDIEAELLAAGMGNLNFYNKQDGTKLSVTEVMQLTGLIDNTDPADFAGDSYVNTPTETLSPGTYYGLDIFEGHIKMLPGVYHIVDAPLIVRRRATLTGDGVSIILHGEEATFAVVDEARLTLTAPTDGPTAGFALAEDRYIPMPGATHPRSRLTGSGRVNAIGTIYLPRQAFAIAGNGAADQASPLLQIVANTIDMSDTGGLKIIFDTSQTDVPAAIQPARTARLVN